MIFLEAIGGVTLAIKFLCNRILVITLPLASLRLKISEDSS